MVEKLNYIGLSPSAMRTLPWDALKSHFAVQKPYATPSVAKIFENLISWKIIRELFLANHDDLFLAKEGRLPKEPILNLKLTFDRAVLGYSMGYTLVVRHAEQAHYILQDITRDCRKILPHF